MKKFFTFAALSVMALTLNSCDQISLKGPKMDSAKGLQQALDAITLDYNEYKPTRIRIWEEEKLNNTAKIVTVDMVSNNDSNYSQAFIIHGAGKGPGKLDGDKHNRNSYDFATTAWVDSRNLSGEKMESNINAAKAQIPEGYSFESVSEYDFRVEKDNIAEKFTLLVTEDGNKVKKSAGQSVIEYYELEFEVLEDGTVYCEILDED